MWFFGRPDVSALAASGQTRKLTKLLRDKRAYLRWRALLALMSQEREGAYDEVAVAFLAADAPEAIRLLGTFLGYQAAPVAGVVTPTLDMQERAAVVRVLSLDATAAAIPLLTFALADPDWYVRWETAHAIRRLNRTLGDDDRKTVSSALVLRVLHDPETRVQHAALDALVTLGESGAFAYLEAVACDPTQDPAVREQAARAAARKLA